MLQALFMQELYLLSFADCPLMTVPPQKEACVEAAAATRFVEFAACGSFVPAIDLHNMVRTEKIIAGSYMSTVRSPAVSCSLQQPNVY